MGCNCSLAVLMILYEDGFITAVFRVCGGTNSQKIDESAEDLQNIWCTAVELEYEGSSSRIWKCCTVFYDVLHLMGSNCVELMDSLGSGQIGEMGGNYSLSSFPSLPTRPLWEQRASTLELKLSTRSSTEWGVCVCVCVCACVCGGGSLDECMTRVFPWLQRKHRICSQRTESLTTSPGEEQKK